MDGSTGYLPEGVIDETGTLVTWAELEQQARQRERERAAKYVKAERARIREWAEQQKAGWKAAYARSDEDGRMGLDSAFMVYDDLLEFLEEE